MIHDAKLTLAAARIPQRRFAFGKVYISERARHWLPTAVPSLIVADIIAQHASGDVGCGHAECLREREDAITQSKPVLTAVDITDTETGVQETLAIVTNASRTSTLIALPRHLEDQELVRSYMGVRQNDG